MAVETTEQALLREFSQLVNDRIGRNTHFLASGAFESIEQAREIVGYLRACQEVKEDFARLVRAFFPST